MKQNYTRRMQTDKVLSELLHIAGDNIKRNGDVTLMNHIMEAIQVVEHEQANSLLVRRHPMTYINKKYTHWLLTLEIRDGEFEYTDRYIVNTREPRDEDSAWVYITNQELDYLEFSIEDEGEATDFNDRHFGISIDPVEPEHLKILNKYLP